MATIHGHEDKEAVVQARVEGKGTEEGEGGIVEHAKWIVPEQESADRRKYFSATGESLDDNSSVQPMPGRLSLSLRDVFFLFFPLFFARRFHVPREPPAGSEISVLRSVCLVP